jgi:hypothetical protein
MNVDQKSLNPVITPVQSGSPPVWLPFQAFPHLNAMTLSSQFDIPEIGLRVRKPPEPSPPPIKEPPDAPENPDAPVREPDPDEPAQM